MRSSRQQGLRDSIGGRQWIGHRLLADLLCLRIGLPIPADRQASQSRSDLRFDDIGELPGLQSGLTSRDPGVLHCRAVTEHHGAVGQPHHHRDCLGRLPDLIEPGRQGSSEIPHTVAGGAGPDGGLVVEEVPADHRDGCHVLDGQRAAHAGSVT